MPLIPNPFSDGYKAIGRLLGQPGAERDEAPLIHLSTDFIRAKEYLEAIVASTSDAICTTDVGGRLIYVSPGAEKMFGVEASELLGRSAHIFYPGGRREAARIMSALRRQGLIEGHEMLLKAKDGRPIHVSMSASLLKDGRGRVIGTLGVSKDITRRVELENRLRELSISDTLTGLYNQRHFHEMLEREASRARRQRYPLSMVLYDLDGFKQANDLWGHLEGDRILKAFAASICDDIRRGVDSAYRYGGDEFVVLLPGLGYADARRVAARIAAAGRVKIAREGEKEKPPVDFSFGVATLSARLSLPQFVHQADVRMFRMKTAKKKLARRARPAAFRAASRPRPSSSVLRAILSEGGPGSGASQRGPHRV